MRASLKETGSSSIDRRYQEDRNLLWFYANFMARPVNEDLRKHVTICIVNFNGEKILPMCLESVLRTSYPSFDILIIDNASEDSSLDVIERFRSRSIIKISVIANKQNLQFAKACNQALKYSTSPYVAILNNDVMVEADWLSNLMLAFQKDGKLAAAQPIIYFCQNKDGQLVNSDEIDSAGSYLSDMGLLVHRRYNELPTGGSDSSIQYVFVAKGAAILFDRQKVLEVGGFDEDFVAFNEEADLCWRIWLAGYRVACVKGSKVYHLGSYSYRALGSKGREIWLYRASRNYILMVTKNIEFRNILVLVRLIILLSSGGILLIFKDTPSGVTLIRGILSILRDLRTIMTKRKMVQSRRIVSDSLLFKRFRANKNLKVYIRALKS
jgi:GT2 family glycosyltransferase